MLSCRVGGGIAGGRVRGGGDLGLLNEVSASQNVKSNMGLFFLPLSQSPDFSQAPNHFPFRSPVLSSVILKILFSLLHGSGSFSSAALFLFFVKSPVHMLRDEL